MIPYNKHIVTITQPKSRAPSHTNIFEVTTRWCLGDMDDMKDEVTYIEPQFVNDLIEALNWAHTNHLDDLDVTSVTNEFPEEYKHFCDLFDYYPTEGSSSMLYNLDDISISYYDHLGVSRECVINWSE